MRGILRRGRRAKAAAAVDRVLDPLLATALRRRIRRQVLARQRHVVGPGSFDERLFDAQEDLIRRYAPGRSFVDIACLWVVEGAAAFLAESVGASPVTAMDKWPATEGYEATHARLGSAVRFVQGDLHDTSTVEAIGVHDVVWCSGLLYHTHDPVRIVAHLSELTGRYLILGSKTTPAVPGLPGVAVYYPGLPPAGRAVYQPTAGALAEPFNAATFGVNWYWGLTPDAMSSIVRSVGSFDLVESVELPWLGRFDDTYLVFERS